MSTKKGEKVKRWPTSLVLASEINDMSFCSSVKIACVYVNKGEGKVKNDKTFSSLGGK